METTIEKRWYLVQCKPRQDIRALENLERQGYTCLLPMYPMERLQKGQWLLHKEPLFPGYLFIELDTLLDNWVPIRSTRGVSQIVRFGEWPVPVPDSVIERLQNSKASSSTMLQLGDKVIVDWAGTCGIEAIFIAKSGTERILLLLNLLQRELPISAPTRRLGKVILGK